jgi:hypothetical protein
MKQRQSQRQNSYAKVLIEGRLPAYIRDMSDLGFRVYSPVPLPIEEGASISCLIIPEDGSGRFELSGEVRWNRVEEEGDDIMGILIGSFPSAEVKKQYSSLLSRFTKDAAEL